MSPSQAELVKFELQRAWDAFRNANHDLLGGFFRGANNRLYYALFYGANSLMLAEGKSSSKHTEVRAFINKEYIKTGKFSRELGKLYNALFDQRSRGDYDLMAEVDPVVLSTQFASVEFFLNQVEKMLSELGFEFTTRS